MLMTDEAVLNFRKNLLFWFNKNKRTLPWRTTRNFYHIWVSEVMLQQTQVVKVINYYNRFIHTFPNLLSLADADLSAVLKVWEGLGYYARARNIHRAAQIIVSQFEGKIPTDYKTFRNLPGVGDYIAAAALSQALNLPFPVVDGNVRRVLSRVFLIEEPANSSTAKNVFNQIAAGLFEAKEPGDFNQAMMELGAIVCRPKNPLCESCPVREVCAASKTGRQDEFPNSFKKSKIPEYEIAVGIILKQKKMLLVQRRPDGLLGGLWEFPGGKIEANESPTDACFREMKEKVGLKIKQIDFVGNIKHVYSHFKIRVAIFRCLEFSGKIRLNEHKNFRWVTWDEIDQFPMHKANLKIIELLEQSEN